MPLRKRLLLLAGAAALVVALALAFRPRPEPVETAVVERGPLVVTIDAEGEARVEDHFVVAAPVGGLVRRIEAEVGDPVRAGDVLAAVESAPSAPLDARTRAELAARVAAAEAAVRRADAQADAAETEASLAAAELARVRPLAADSVLAPAELERYAAAGRRAANAHAAADATAEAARQDLRAARALLQTGAGTRLGEAVPVRAPASGTVLAVHHPSEGVVAAGQPLLDVGDPGALEVAADVLSDEATRIAPGMRALVEAGGRTIEGAVRRVEPVAFTEVSALGVEEQRVLVIVALGEGGEAPPRLGHGYRVRVRFVEWNEPAVLRIPTSALFEHDGEPAVFVVEGGRAEVRTVTVGQRAGLWAEVLGGLAAGDRVVTHPGDALADGARVEVVD